MTDKEDEVPAAQSINSLMTVGMLGVLLAWGGFGYFLKWDAVSALFTGLAFVGVIATMRLQSEELKLQRAELKLTREELRGQKEQLQAQNRTMQQQTFEVTYFQLLRSFRELSETITDPRLGGGPGNTYWSNMRAAVFDTNTSFKIAHGDVNAQVNIFDQMLKKYTSIAPYFSYLDELLRFLENSDFGQNPLYARLLRAQLRVDELIFIAFYGLSVVGSRALKGRLERFAILKFLPTEQPSPAFSLPPSYRPNAMLEPEAG